uniref:Arrestin_C domain-containing protein n=2 Tax=Caenorhabditis tropicalis TaxID=1561998 RepID=A0A1I7TM64_9PELO
MEVLQHDVHAFTNRYLTGKSFDDIEMKVVEKETEKGIHFGVDFKVHKDAIDKFDKIGQMIQSNQCILQHNLIMHSFIYTIQVVGEDENEGLLVKLSIVPIGYTFRYPLEMKKGGVPITFKPEVPELKDVKWILKNGETMNLLKENNGSYSCDIHVSLASFKNFIENGVAVLRVEMTIDKEYFEIGEYVNMDLKEARVASNSSQILEKILKGEEVPKSDWVISASEGFPRDFHVHGPVLADSSMVLRGAITSHMSIGKEIAMISSENRFILTNLKSKDMKVRSDTLKTISECVKSMICVTCSPQGSLLAAYNVSLIVAADAWQMAEAKGKKVNKEKVKKLIGESWPIIDSLLETIEDFKVMVCGVEKTMYIE